MSDLTGADRIIQERIRQINKEEWSAGHDDEYEEDELSWAAVCYAAPSQVFRYYENELDDPWPWVANWDKRDKHDRIRQLEIAGALIAAEIDRLLRKKTEQQETE